MGARRRPKKPQLPPESMQKSESIPLRLSASTARQKFRATTVILFRLVLHSASGIWFKRDKITNIVFRCFTLLSVGYLVWDRFFETEVTISSPASDQHDPFKFPFSLANNSHIFTIRNLDWSCHVVHMTVGGITLDNVSAGNSDHSTEIPPGKTLVVPCKSLYKGPPPTNLSLQIDVLYDVRVFGFIPYSRCPSEIFRWYDEASNPTWIKGEEAGGRTKYQPIQRGGECLPISEATIRSWHRERDKL